MVLAFFAIYIIWGTTYVAVLFGLEGFPPFLLSAIRFSVAGMVLLGWCLMRGEQLPSLRDCKVPVAGGIIMLVGGSALIAWAEQYVTSGQAAIVVATEPFLFLLLDKKGWAFYFSGKRIMAGLLTGFIGILLFFLFAPHPTGAAINPTWKAVGYVVLFTSAVLWVGGSLYSKRNMPQQISNTTATALQLIAAGLFCTLLSGVTGEWNAFSFAGVSAKAWGGLLYLMVMGSLVAYLAFTWLLSIRPPAIVSTHTYVNPVVAVLMGWAIAHERITAMQVAALLLILTGVMLVNKKSDSTETVTVREPAAATAQ